jgi:Plant transposon protein
MNPNAKEDSDEEQLVNFRVMENARKFAQIIAEDREKIEAEFKAKRKANAPRKKRGKYRHGEAWHCVMRDYIGPDPLYGSEFPKIFRISRPRFQRLMEDFGNSDIAFFSNNQPYLDGDGHPKASLEAKLLYSLKSLAYGVPPRAFMDYFQFSETYGRSCIEQFCWGICTLYQNEYLCAPSKWQTKRLSDLHEGIHRGVPGMFGSLDCMHTPWKNCPYAWQQSYKGAKGKPTLVLEAVADYRLYFHHAAFGFAGCLNDINVLNQSPLLDQFMGGKFEDIESEAVPFNIAGSQFNKMFILVDGIYPKFSRFVKTVKEPVTHKQRVFASWQESARKDIERAFGVLQGKWQAMARPILLMDLETVGKLANCCLCLHNMCVSDRVMDGDPRALYDPCHNMELLPEKPREIEQSQEFQKLVREANNQVEAVSMIGSTSFDTDVISELLQREARFIDLADMDEHVRLHLAIYKLLCDTD